MSTAIWHPFPGRLQSVSVADKDNIWGVTLDLQLCKFDIETQRWQLVSVSSETIHHARFSSPSVPALQAPVPTSSSFTAAKMLSSYLPSLSSFASLPAAPTGGIAAIAGPPTPTPEISRSNSPVSPVGADAEEDTTIQVSAASDGTVVRLDRSLKAWYLIAPHKSHVDYERDVIWVDLGHFWKCVSVASLSQIWGLSDDGDIFYGTSDRFVLLERSITSGAGYKKPSFTHISVGHDNVVLATDAHSGTVFRLMLHPTGACPPIWTALAGTGPGSNLHIVNCSLSTIDFVVGVANDGRVYQYSRGVWISLGGGAKMDNIGVGTDGYVLGVDRDGDLFGCQLESARPAPISLDNASIQEWAKHTAKNDDYSIPNSPQAPNGPSMLGSPRMSRRQNNSPRELFDLASPRDSSIVNHTGRFIAGGLRIDTSNRNTRKHSSLREPGTLSRNEPHSHSYPKSTTLYRSDSQTSKRSYASDIVSRTPNDISVSAPVSPPSPEHDFLTAPATPISAVATPIETKPETAATSPPEPTGSHAKVVPLRIRTRGMSRPNQAPPATENESVFMSKPFTTFGSSSNLSPMTSSPLDGNPYIHGSGPSSNQSTAQTPSTPHSTENFGDSRWTVSSQRKVNTGVANPADRHNALLESPSTGERDNEPVSPQSVLTSVSQSTPQLDRSTSVASSETVSETREEHQPAQPCEALVDYKQDLITSPTVIDSRPALEVVEITEANETPDIHRGPFSRAMSDGSVAQADTQRSSSTPPLQLSSSLPSSNSEQQEQLIVNHEQEQQPADNPSADDTVSTSPISAVEFNHLQTSGKSEWMEDNNKPSDDNGSSHVNMARLDGHRNDDDEHVWNGDTAVMQSNLDQDKREPIMPSPHSEVVSSTSSYSRSPLPSSNENPLPLPLPSLLRKQQQQQHLLQQVQLQSQQPQQQNLQQQQYPYANNQSESGSFGVEDKNSSNNTKQECEVIEINYRDYCIEEEEEDCDQPVPPSIGNSILAKPRLSDVEELLALQQQQEFLRKTRLRSVAFEDNSYLRDLSERTGIPLDLYPLPNKTEADDNQILNNANNNSSHFLLQVPVQQQQPIQPQLPAQQLPPIQQPSPVQQQHPILQRPSFQQQSSFQQQPPIQQQPTFQQQPLIQQHSPFQQQQFQEHPPFQRQQRPFQPQPPFQQQLPFQQQPPFQQSPPFQQQEIRNRPNDYYMSSNNINKTALDEDDNNNPIPMSSSAAHLQNYINTTFAAENQQHQGARKSLHLASHPLMSNTNNFNNNNSNIPSPPLPSADVPGVHPGLESGLNNNNGPMVMNNNVGSMMKRQGNDKNPYGIDQNNARYSTAAGTSLTLGSTASTGGVTGEDAHGRWVGSPEGAHGGDSGVIMYNPDVKKSKCCIIL
ncbi:hypothetical protein FBU30_007578 [Linnemannia zychae]|nr:hypothetical protein FBU30_007578 [Linnemannia zychae]